MSERPLHEGKLDRAQTLSNIRSEATYEAISVNPVTPVIGVEVEGVDMTSDVPDAQIEELNQALANHNVLFFRDQPELTAEQQIAFAKRFGELHIHPAAPQGEKYPELFVIHTHGESFVNNGADWHTDVSCDEEPPLGTMLQIHRTPPSGRRGAFLRSRKKIRKPNCCSSTGWRSSTPCSSQHAPSRYGVPRGGQRVSARRHHRLVRILVRVRLRDIWQRSWRKKE